MRFLYFYIWPLFNILYDKIFNWGVTDTKLIENKPKVIRNFISASNAGGVLLFSGAYFLTNYRFFYTISIMIPYTYYIWDTMYILIKDKKNELGYIYHHFIALLLLNQLEKKSDLRQLAYAGLITAELSNITTYIVYHYSKKLDKESKESRDNLLFWKKCQLFWFGILRIPVFGVFLYKTYYKVSTPYFIQYSLLYIIGIYWFTKQYKSFMSIK